jgi:hypothetical protein
MHVQSTNVIKHANASKLATHYQTPPQTKYDDVGIGLYAMTRLS